VKEGEAECGVSTRRRSSPDIKEVTRRQFEEYVRNILGIKKGRNYRRLVGWIGEDASGTGSRDSP